MLKEAESYTAEIHQYEKKILELKTEISRLENDKENIQLWVRRQESKVDDFSLKLKQMQFEQDERKNSEPEKMLWCMKKKLLKQINHSF